MYYPSSVIQSFLGNLLSAFGAEWAKSGKPDSGSIQEPALFPSQSIPPPAQPSTGRPPRSFAPAPESLQIRPFSRDAALLYPAPAQHRQRFSKAQMSLRSRDRD